MLEAAIVLEVATDRYVEAAIIAVLLVFNAALGLFQESRAQATLVALKSRLALSASVRRDGAWKTLPAMAPSVLRIRAEGRRKSLTGSEEDRR
jgi:H+-transporting ATPase